MRHALALLMTIAVAVAASAGMRDRGPVAEGSSSRSVSELQACAAVALTKARGYEVRTSEGDGSAKVTLVMRAAGIPATVGAVDIGEADGKRHVAGYATGKQTGAPVIAIRRAVSACTT